MTEYRQDRLTHTEGTSGDLLTDLRYARDHCVLCDLSDYALLAIEGPDAESFLQGQLSSDVRALTRERCQLSTYNSPKGRVLATLLLWRVESGFVLQLPASLGEPVLRRLSMYVLRSKVRLSAANERYFRIGVGGPGAGSVLDAAGLMAPDADFGLARKQTLTYQTDQAQVDIAMRLGADRYELLLSDADAALALSRILNAHGARPADIAAWQWLTVRSGTAEIVAETQDKFVAQMLNYELIGGISFNKGCYPGQEIVARTQYRGELKRRTLLAHTEPDPGPAPGQEVFSAAFPSAAVGSVVSSAPSPAGGHDLLACLFLERAGDALHLSTPDGPHIELSELPYELPVRS